MTTGVRTVKVTRRDNIWEVVSPLTGRTYGDSKQDVVLRLARTMALNAGGLRVEVVQ